MRSPCLRAFIFPEKSEYHPFLGKRMKKEKRGEEACTFKERGMWEIIINAEWESKQLGEYKRISRQN